jgi:hypothetical protein
MNHPRSGTSPGIFLEHFDFSEPLDVGQDGIIYRGVYLAAKEAAAVSGWGFRSYSSKETPGTRQDFVDRNIRSFPMVILYRDGIEVGRWVISLASVEDFQNWAHKLLGRPTDDEGPPPEKLSL